MIKPHIGLLSLGGTIAGVADERGRSKPTLGARDLTNAASEISEIANVAEVANHPAGSHELTLEDLSWVAHTVRAEAENGIDGLVISQGSDTLEETAYALALQLDRKIPVVLTAAMRPSDAAGADGPGNLLAALRVAAAPDVAGLGPVVVLQDEIHAARWVTKLHTSRVGAFASPTSGPVGEVIEGKVHIRSVPVNDDHLGLPARLQHSVDVIWTTLGSDGFLIESSASRADGIVVAAMGGGSVTVDMMQALGRAVDRGVPVVLASRCLHGPSLTSTYAGPATERDLLDLGLMPVGCLSAIKARLRMIVALARGLDPSSVFPVDDAHPLPDSPAQDEH